MLRQINSMHPDSVLPDLQWLKTEYSKIKCAACNSINRSRFPEPLNVVLSHDPGDRVSGHISRTGIAIYHRNLLEALQPHLGAFVLGTTRMANDVVLNDYLTCYAKTFFVPRGDSKASYYSCDICGKVSLNTGGQRHQYVLRKDLTDASVYQSASTWLYLRDELAAQIDWSQWPDANLDEVRVIDKPYDQHRLPGDPDWGAPAS